MKNILLSLFFLLFFVSCGSTFNSNSITLTKVYGYWVDKENKLSIELNEDSTFELKDNQSGYHFKGVWYVYSNSNNESSSQPLLVLKNELEPKYTGSSEYDYRYFIFRMDGFLGEKLKLMDITGCYSKNKKHLLEKSIKDDYTEQ